MYLLLPYVEVLFDDDLLVRGTWLGWPTEAWDRITEPVSTHPRDSLTRSHGSVGEEDKSRAEAVCLHHRLPFRHVEGDFQRDFDAFVAQFLDGREEGLEVGVGAASEVAVGTFNHALGMVW